MSKKEHHAAKRMTILKQGVVLSATAALAIYLGGQAPKFIKQWKSPFTSGDFAIHVKDQAHNITLYGRSSCPHCTAARAFLDQSGVAYNYRLIDVSTEAMQSFEQLHENAVPALVSKHKLLVGFNKNAYAEFINSEIKK